MRTTHLPSGSHQMLVPVEEGDPKVNKFEQISSDRHQMSLAGGLYSEVLCPKAKACTVRSYAPRESLYIEGLCPKRKACTVRSHIWRGR